MRHLEWLFLFLVLPASVQAGGDWVSRSTVSGHFLSIGPTAYVASDSIEQIEKLRELCERKGRLWAWRTARYLDCKSFSFVEQPLDHSYYALEMKVTAGPEIGPDEMMLVSVELFEADSWDLIGLDDANVDIDRLRQEFVKEIIDILYGPEGQYPSERESLAGVYLAALKNLIEQATTVTANRLSNNTILLFVPALPGDDEEDESWVVVTIAPTGETDLFNFAGEPVGLVDVDRDGMPEILVSQQYGYGYVTSFMPAPESARVLIHLESH